MENINNSQDVANVQPVSDKSDKNIFKILFFVTLFVLIGTIIVSLFLIKKNEQQSNNNIDNITTSIEESTQISATPNSITEENKKYEVISLQDDTNSVTKLILKDNQGLETVIDEAKYWEMNDESDLVAKPEFNNFIFSPDNNFLYYFYSSGWEVTESFLYDIENKEKVDLGFPIYSENPPAFTSDSTYFYGCSQGGMANGGAIIFNLKSLSSIYKKEGSFVCNYNKENNSLLITEEISISDQKNTEYFSFTSGTLTN